MPVAKILYRSLYWKIFQFGSSFLVNIIFARAFQSVISAEFYSLVYLLSLVVTFFTLGLDIGLNFYLSKRSVLPGTAHRIIFIIAVLAVVISLPLIYAGYRPYRYPDLPPGSLQLFSALAIAGNLLTVLSGALFTAYARNYFPAKITVFFNAAAILLSLLICWRLSGAGMIRGLFYVYFLLSFIQGLFLYLLSFRIPLSDNTASSQPANPAGGNGSAVPVGLRQLLRFSFAAFATNFIFYAGTRISLYLLPLWVSPGDQGNFIQAFKIVEYMTIAAAFLYYPFIALVAGEDRRAMNGTVLFMIRLCNTIVLLISLGLLATGWWLFPLLFGRSYDHMYVVLLWCIPGIFASCSSTFFTAYYFGSGNLRVNFISSCIQMITGLVFFFLLAKKGGITGAALAFSLSTCASLLYDGRVFWKIFPFSPRDLLFINRVDTKALVNFLRQQSSRGDGSPAIASGSAPAIQKRKHPRKNT